MPSTQRRYRLLLSIAALPVLAAARGPCAPEMPIGEDGTDAGAATEDDGGSPADDGDSGPEDAEEQPPEVDLAAAARVCTWASACLHGQVFLQPCIAALASSVTSEQYRAMLLGRAATLLEGELGSGGTSPTFGFPPRANPLVVPSMLAEPDVRACIEAAATCDDVLTCMNGGVDSPECEPAAGTTRCDGSVLQACLYTDWTVEGFPPDVVGSAPRSFTFDCATQGQSCTRGDDGGTAWYGCSPGACAAASCDGDVAANCWFGHSDRTSCDGGASCTVVPSGLTGQAVCAPDGPACDPAQSPARCDGDTVVTCRRDVEVRTECTAPLVCATLEAGESFCGFGDECSLAEGTRCSGTSIETCVLGRWVATDCADLGLATCTERFPGQPFCS